MNGSNKLSLRADTEGKQSGGRMKRSVTLLLTAIVAMSLVSSAFALPTAVITPKGLSPTEVAANANDIYDIKSSGLGNVGIGEKIYLAGSPRDATITAWTWAMTAKPANSQSALSATDVQVVSFVPDLSGTYTLTLQVTNPTGQSAAVTYKVNAANYVGVGGITGAGDVNAPECYACHNGDAAPDVVADWRETPHASAWGRKYNGEAGSHFGPNCVSCHVTGYNAAQSANNNGFDDRARAEGWVFVDSAHGGLVPGAWDSMKAHYPETSKMGTIGCEMCHGPGSRHNANTADNKISMTLEAGVCSQCHESGSHHIYPTQWKRSGHSRQPEESRQGCVDCHSGRGFIDNLAGVPDSLANLSYVPIGCATCHDPHSEANPKQVRNVAPYTFLNGVQADIGLGNLCIRCHHARTDVRTYPATRPGARFSPHYGPQGEMFVGTGGVEYGRQMRNGPHAAVIENGCVGCHMAATPAAGAGLNKVGSHTFVMADTLGYEHTEVCAPCHGEVESFESFQASGDWDHDGTTETVPLELQGMMATITSRLPRGINVPDTNYTLQQKQAYYNYIFVTQDKSNGMHNAYYARDILQASIDDLPVGRTQRLTLARGWNTVSINITPAPAMWVAGAQGADVVRMLAGLRIDANNHRVSIMKDDMGNFYLPQFGFNNIAYWNLADGYQIKVTEDCTIDYTGMAINPATAVPLAEGWNTVAYLPNYLLSADAPNMPVVASIANHLLVAKDDMGHFMLPAFQFSNMAAWAPGKGYQVKVDAACNLTYPAQQQGRDATVEPIVANHWTAPASTGSSMSILLTDLNATDGSQISAVSKSGAIVGVGTVQAGRCGLPVWGDDKTTEVVDGLTDGETFSLTLWNAETGIESAMSAKMVLGSGLTFKVDDIAVAKAIVIETLPTNFYLGKNFPNPFNSTTKFAFGLPEAGQVSVKVFDLAGRTIATLVDGNLTAGNHIAVWTADAAPAGLYLVKMQAGSFSDTRKVTLLK